MKQQLTWATRIKVAALTTALMAAGCAQAVANRGENSETIDLKKVNDKTQLVLVTGGGTKTYDWSASQLADPAELEKALAEVPAAKREQVRQLLAQLNEGKGFQFVTEGDHKVVIHRLGDNADGLKMLTNNTVRVHKIAGGDGSEFGLLKSLLAEAQLSKAQLQELQQLLDSKY